MRGRIRYFDRGLPLLIAALVVAAPMLGWPAEGDKSKTRAGQDGLWLTPSDHELLRRSYLHCLRAQYARLGDVQHETVLVAAFNRDLEHLSLLVSPEDIKRAPWVLVSGVPYIDCEWFSDGSASAR